MLHILQSLKDGTTRLADVPVPLAGGASLLVRSHASVISAGTERMLLDFGRAGWLEKARSQPDKVKQVLEKVRTDGLQPTLEAVRAKLDAPIPLGYCEAGVVVEVGPKVQRFAPGDRVVTNGPHAEYVRVPHTLAARIPDAVSFEAAAFTPIAAIGLQGLRLAAPTLGETVVVYGLGLIGLLTVQLARANGCRVIGIDRVAARCAMAERFGAVAIEAAEGRDVAGQVRALTGEVGADVVLLTVATDSYAPAHRAGVWCRPRGRIGGGGGAGLPLRRDDFYRKELSFQVSCSYGPGRYDAQHEEGGVDYPLPYVRWTEGRNFEAVLGLMASGQVDPLPLVSHRFTIARAADAYALMARGEPSLGIVIDYPATAVDVASQRTVTLREAPAVSAAKGVVGCIGAGNFGSRVLVPAFRAAGAQLRTVASSGGVSAAVVGEAQGFERATTEAASLLADAAIDTVIVATRHDSHASWGARALEAGKHVFVEKPLALTGPELDRVREAHGRAAGQVLCVGFNRRFAPHVQRARAAMAARRGPLVATITVNAGAIPPEHWTHDPEVGGGRIVGEGCHFIDLARFLAGAPIAEVQVVSARRGPGGPPVEDVSLIQLAFADGSLASIQYLANGHKGFPKERIELFADGRIVRIDNFRTLEGWGVAGDGLHLPRAQDKGHRALVAAFVGAVRGELPVPIPPAELFEVSRAAILAGSLAMQGGGSARLAEGA
jgi:predicted dehydrogenase/threonine dehydrogenase-like Zn-dependent dehydrogenase